MRAWLTRVKLYVIFGAPWKHIGRKLSSGAACVHQLSSWTALTLLQSGSPFVSNYVCVCRHIPRLICSWYAAGAAHFSLSWACTEKCARRCSLPPCNLVAEREQSIVSVGFACKSHGDLSYFASAWWCAQRTRGWQWHMDEMSFLRALRSSFAIGIKDILLSLKRTFANDCASFKFAIMVYVQIFALNHFKKHIKVATLLI